MIDEGDAFIALPGGTGTLDEISEVITMTRLGLMGDIIRPVMLYNINGFYDHLRYFFDRVLSEGFFREADRKNIIEVRSIDDIEEVLSKAGAADQSRNRLYR
jgi:hypothetical protein